MIQLIHNISAINPSFHLAVPSDIPRELAAANSRNICCVVDSATADRPVVSLILHPCPALMEAPLACTESYSHAIYRSPTNAHLTFGPCRYIL